jgi:hypothetical protein
VLVIRIKREKMTVKELIEKLSEYDGDLSVNIQNGDEGGCYTGSRVVSTLYFEDGCIILDD